MQEGAAESKQERCYLGHVQAQLLAVLPLPACQSSPPTKIFVSANNIWKSKYHKNSMKKQDST